MNDKLEKIRKIELVPYDPKWAVQFESEAHKIREILKANCLAIHHIGSTAIPGIYAKPVIDILVVVNDLVSVDALNSAFESLEYACMGEYGIAGRRFYWKSKHKRTHHIHLFECDHSEIKRHLEFRNYMVQHPDAARGYSWVKRCLAEQFSDNMVAYVKGKDSFIRAMDYRAGVAKSDQLAAKDQIVLEPYNPNWKKLALAEINAIKRMVSLPSIAIEHLGSTAIAGLSAKPIIDIFIALATMDDAEQWSGSLKSLGYVDWPDNPDKMHQRFFKGMPPFGIQRTHHVHIMPFGKDFKQRVAFRDLLRQHTDLRRNYTALKRALAKQYPDDREAYTEAKASFIKEVLNKGQNDPR